MGCQKGVGLRRDSHARLHDAPLIDAPMSQLDSEVKKALEAALQQGHVEAKFLAKLEDCSGNDLSKIYQTLAMRIIDYQKKGRRTNRLYSPQQATAAHPLATGVTSTGFASQLCLQWMSRRFPEVAISAYPRLFQEYGNYESMPAVGHTLTWLVSQTTAHDPSEAMMGNSQPWKHCVSYCVGAHPWPLLV